MLFGVSLAEWQGRDLYGRLPPILTEWALGGDPCYLPPSCAVLPPLSLALPAPDQLHSALQLHQTI